MIFFLHLYHELEWVHFTSSVGHVKGSDCMANIVIPDQTATSGIVLSGFTMLQSDLNLQ